MVAFLSLIESFYPKNGSGRRPMPLGTMFRILLMQQWLSYSAPAMEEALYDMPLLRQFAGLDAFEDVMLDESNIHHFRHLQEKHDLAAAIFAKVDAVLSEKGLSMKRGNVLGATLIRINGYINGVIHPMECTTDKVTDIAMMEKCLYGEEAIALGDRGYHKKNRMIGAFQKEGNLSVLTPTKRATDDTLTEEQKSLNRKLS